MPLSGAFFRAAGFGDDGFEVFGEERGEGGKAGDDDAG